MNGDKVDNVKLSAYFDEFARENPDWQPAVASMKSACLQSELPAQGIFLNCPAYDTMQCSFASFIKVSIMFNSLESVKSPIRVR